MWNPAMNGMRYNLPQPPPVMHHQQQAGFMQRQQTLPGMNSTLSFQHHRPAANTLPLVQPSHAAVAPLTVSQSKVAYTAFSEGSDKNEVVIQTLTGDFAEVGNNHNRPTYQKQGPPGTVPPEIFIYYWDQRDGPAFEGWWFGKSVGGNEVWSHNPSQAMRPPQKGWKIPFAAAEPRATFNVVPKAGTAAVGSSPAPALNNPRPVGSAPAARPGQTAPAAATSNALQVPNSVQVARQNLLAANAATVKSKLEDVNNAMNAANAAIESAKLSYGDLTKMEGLDEAETALKDVPEMLQKAQKALEGSLSIAGTMMTEVRTTNQKALLLIQTLKTEQMKVRVARPRIVAAQKVKETEAKDQAALDTLMTDPNNKVNEAEDLVEKTVITHGVVEADGEDDTEVKLAVEQTHQLAVQANVAIKEALALLGQRMVAIKNFSPKIRDKANSDLNALRIRIRDLSLKLQPLSNVKQLYAQKEAANQVVKQINSALVPAELELDRAIEASEPLQKENPTSEQVEQSKLAISVAYDKLQAALVPLEQKMRMSQGLLLTELQKCEVRARTAEKKLGELKNMHKLIQERDASSTMLNDVQEKMTLVDDSIKSLEEVLAPYLMGVERVEASEEGIKAGDDALKAASKATSTARIVISMRLVEVKRFSAENGGEAQRSLQEWQKKLEASMKKISDLRTSLQERKQHMQRMEAVHKVEQVEKLAASVAATGTQLLDEEKVAQMSPDEIRSMGGECRGAFTEAQTAIAKAQDTLTVRQVEAKKADDENESASLAKLQQRLRAAMQSMTPYKTLPPAVERQIAVKIVCDEAAARVAAVEAKVEEVVTLVANLGAPSEEANASPSAPAQGSPTPGQHGLAMSGALMPRAKGLPKAAAQPIRQRPIDVTNAACNAAIMLLKTVHRHLDMMEKTGEVPEAHVKELKERLAAAQAKLETAQKDMRSSGEKIIAREQVADVERHVNNAVSTIDTYLEIASPALDAVAVAAEAGEGMEEGQPETPVVTEETQRAMKDAATRAAKAVHDAKTIISIKKNATVRLAENVAVVAREELARMQTMLDAAYERMMTAQKALNDKKFAKVKAEINGMFEACEDAVEIAIEMANELLKDSQEMDEGNELDVQTLAAHGMKAQGEAATKIAETRLFLNTKMAELKGEVSMQQELSQLITKVATMQVQLDKKKKEVQELEHKLILNKLVKEAEGHFSTVESRLETAREATQVLTAPDHEDFVGTMFLTRCFDALMEYAAEGKKSCSDIFGEMKDGDSGVSQAGFVKFVMALPSLKKEDAMPLGETEIQAAYNRMDTVGGGQVAERQFEEYFKSLMDIILPIPLMSALEGGSEIKDLASNEVVEVLEKHEKDEASGKITAKVRSGDGTEGYITIVDGEAQTYACPHSSYDVCLRRIEAAFKDVKEALDAAGAMLRAKADSLTSSGPIADARAKGEIMKLKLHLSKLQTQFNQLMAQVSEAKRTFADRVEQEKRKRDEIQEKARANKILAEAEKTFAALQTAVESVLAKMDTYSSSSTWEALKAGQAELIKTEENLKAVEQKLVKDPVERIKTDKGPMGEAKRTLIKYKVRLSPFETKLKRAMTQMSLLIMKLESSAHQKLTEAMRKTSGSSDVVPHKLFSKLAGDGSVVPIATLRDFLLSSLREDKPKDDVLDLALHKYKAGVSKMQMLVLLTEYKRCSKDTALTSMFEVKACETLRKLEKGEIVEALGAPQKDETVGLERIRCRALQDGQEGWVTAQGNQGTLFVEPMSKPFLRVREATSAYTDTDQSSDPITTVEAGELIEVLEGPKAGRAVEVLRARGKAIKDAKFGHVVISDSTSSTPNLEPLSLMVCKTTTVLTSEFDITGCTPVRKIDVGEKLEALEEPQKDEGRKMTRVKVRCRKDGQEGYATVTGSQGTTYLVEGQFYICRHSTPITLTPGGRVVRDLEVDELFEVMDGPTKEKKEGTKYIRGRVLSSGEEGWFLQQAGLPWSCSLRCVKVIPLAKDGESPTGEAHRNLAVGEAVEVVDVTKTAEGKLRWEVRTTRDGLTGFVWMSAEATAQEAPFQPA